MRVLVVGAGPAGLMATLKLAENGVDVTLVDKERRIGGAGLRSDGKLNFDPEIGHSLVGLLGRKRVEKYLEEVKSFFKGMGVETKEPSSWLKRVFGQRALSSGGYTFMASEQAHLGTDVLSALLARSEKRLVAALGVDLKLGVEKYDLDFRGHDALILAPGRSGAVWVRKLLGEDFFIPGPIDIGLRIEFSSILTEFLSEVGIYDLKIKGRTKRFDDPVRTFCMCHGGYVIKEAYPEGLVGVNGHSFSASKGSNSNIALLSEVNLTEPVEDATKLGLSIARTFFVLGEGSPLVQRLGDLRRGRRSTLARIERNKVKPTLGSAVPGDISLALPARILCNLLELLEVLDALLPGVNSDPTLLYGPEIKFYSGKAKVNEWFQTRRKDIYLIGDASGYTRSIVGAMISGLVAAEALLGESS